MKNALKCLVLIASLSPALSMANTKHTYHGDDWSYSSMGECIADSIDMADYEEICVDLKRAMKPDASERRMMKCIAKHKTIKGLDSEELYIQILQDCEPK